MPSTKKKLRAFGADIAHGTDGIAWDDALDIQSIEPPALKRKNVDTGHLNSPNEGNESMPGDKEVQAWKIVAHFTHADYAYLKDIYEVAQEDYDTSNPPYWRCRAPLLSGEATRTEWVIRGWIQELGRPKFTPGEDKPLLTEFTIMEADCEEDYTEGA